MTATQSLVKSATNCLSVPLLQMEFARNQSDFSLMCLYPFKSSCSSSTQLRCALYPCRAIILPAPVGRSPKASLLYLTPRVFWPFDKQHSATKRAGGAAIGTIASLLLGGRLTQGSQFIANLKKKKSQVTPLCVRADRMVRHKKCSAVIDMAALVMIGLLKL